MLILLILCAVVSATACALLLRLGQESARRYSLDAAQRFHIGHVPRLGGAAMFVACSVGWLWMAVSERYLGLANRIEFAWSLAFFWWFAALACVAPGVIEDLTHRLPARYRFVGTGLAAILATLLLGL